MRYCAISVKRYLRRLRIDAQRLQHSFVCVCYGPGKAVSLSVLFQPFDTFVGACANNVEGDLVIVARTDVILDAPQLDAAGSSPGCVKVQESRLALISETGGS